MGCSSSTQANQTRPQSPPKNTRPGSAPKEAAVKPTVREDPPASEETPVIDTDPKKEEQDTNE
ncbi:hypothetical protein Bbelb_263240, partial [Branchiostoma belcheri]